MKKLIFATTLLIIGVLIISGKPKSPKVFYEMFAKMTKSKLIMPQELNALVDNKKCALISSKSYAGPVALSIKGDMKKAAKGVDEYVELEGGNAYHIKNYKWENFGHLGSTQLNIDFDIYKCDIEEANNN